MKNEQNFKIKSRIRSFRFALQGLAELFKYELNSRIHLLAAIIAIIAGVVLRINRFEWCVIAVVIGFVISAELINTSIESLADATHPETNDSVRKVKDYAAAAVLIAALVSVIAGCLIFIPRIIDLIK